MKHLPMGWLLPTAVLLLPAMPGNTAHTSEKGENMKHEKTAKVTSESIVRLSKSPLIRTAFPNILHLRQNAEGSPWKRNRAS